MSKTFKHRWPEAPNLMNRLWLLGPIAILLLSAAAQEAGPAGFEHWAPASLKRFESKMHADASADPHHFAVELLADFPNDSAMLVHREPDGQAEWHETQVDVFFVQSGSATLLIGGTLVNGETVWAQSVCNSTAFPTRYMRSYLSVRSRNWFPHRQRFGWPSMPRK